MLLSLGGCAYPQAETIFSSPARIEVKTAATDQLRALPSPTEPLTVAVYSFTDQTGQNKPNDQFTEYSSAVTQGGAAILVDALRKTGNGAWFDVVERQNLNSLLQERQIIRATFQEYEGVQTPPLPPLTFAGLILDGGIIGYDSNTLTGGFGARFLGVGADTQYRRDTVTVYLRAVSVQNGEVLESVNVSKTIYSVAGRGGAFRFVGFKKLLEIEAGVTTNEPVLLATRQAVEKAVYALVMEGLLSGYWDLADASLTERLVEDYLQERNGVYDVRQIGGEFGGSTPGDDAGLGTHGPP